MITYPFIITIAGGTSSGKTSVSRAIIETLGEDKITYISYDNYYFDLSHLSKSEIESVNFDHPISLDTYQLCKDLKQMINKQSISIPQYDFKTHTRQTDCLKVEPRNIILVEGILALHHPEIRNLSNLKIFVDTPADERLIRRIQRDITNRGRSLDEVIYQYKQTVKPMHEQFIEPTRVYADIIIPNGYNKTVVDLLVNSMLSTTRTEK